MFQIALTVGALIILISTALDQFRPPVLPLAAGRNQPEPVSGRNFHHHQHQHGPNGHQRQHHHQQTGRNGRLQDMGKDKTLRGTKFTEINVTAEAITEGFKYISTPTDVMEKWKPEALALTKQIWSITTSGWSVHDNKTTFMKHQKMLNVTATGWSSATTGRSNQTTPGQLNYAPKSFDKSANWISWPLSFGRVKRSTSEAMERKASVATRSLQGMNTWASFQMPILEGWDCASPSHMRRLAFTPDDNCHSTPQTKKIEQVSLSLLQFSKKTAHAGYTCDIEETRRVYHCGMWGHVTPWNGKSYFDIPRRIPSDVCEEMHNSGTYVDQTGNNHTLTKKGITILNYEIAGESYNSHGNIWCNGEATVIDGEKLNSALVQIQQKIRVKPEVVYEEDGIISSRNDEVVLPCNITELSCVTDVRTWIWEENSDNPCPFAWSKNFEANWVTEESGQEIVISNDGQAIRLIIHEKEIHCGEELFSTNYPEIFVTKRRENQYKWRLIRAHEVSIQQFIRNADDFVFNSIDDRVNREIAKVMDENCRQFADKDIFKLLAQQQGTGRTSWHMKNGTFATISGEIVFLYQCQRVVATPRETGKCYQAVPVTILQPSTLSNTSVEWFLEPVTRRLTWEGLIVPCNRHVAPSIRTVDNKWIAYWKHIQYVPAPQLQYLSYNWSDHRNQDPGVEVDFAKKAGIYSREMIEGSAEMYSQMDRRGQSLLNTLINGMRKSDYNKDRYMLDDLFPDKDMLQGWKEGIFGPIADYFTKIFYIMMFVVGILILTCCSSNITRLILGCTKHGCSKETCEVCCFSWFQLKTHLKNSAYVIAERGPWGGQEHQLDTQRMSDLERRAERLYMFTEEGGVGERQTATAPTTQSAPPYQQPKVVIDPL